MVTLDTANTDQLASFWTDVLGLHEVEREDGDRWIVLAEPDGTRRLGFQRSVRPWQPCRWHLDLSCELEDFDDEVARLCEIGASLLQPTRHESYGAIANLADPDGNPFDLCAYVPGPHAIG